ncbi:hypothetical protein RhiXN_10401 [Rhizoctonia solani]|uniref:Uncharacterized protein n=1 Tax=Rhizoctonia solani TaxID=456999 RepID=A0A8H8P5R5_9AGAM|nr:uncharacterized protein RhiXN_10401 [Rhizoctonia solani]QRW24077.1 hypothetical protein RhiXN_10401 [Rhizoctonia solani]
MPASHDIDSSENEWNTRPGETRNAGDQLKKCWWEYAEWADIKNGIYEFTEQLQLPVKCSGVWYMVPVILVE